MPPIRFSQSPARTLAGVFAAALVAVALLTGCGESSGGSDGKLPDSIVMAYPYPVENMDVPTGGFSTSYLASLVNEPLMLSGRQNALTPALATSVDTPDSTTLVFHLRSGVEFSDGNPLTPEDVVWSIEHDLSETSQVASYLPNFKSASASGPNEVTVHLTKPTPAAVGAMAYSVYVQEKAAAVKHLDDLGTADALPIGSGPYQVQSLTTDAVTFTRNPHYWGDPAPVKTIKMSFISNDNTAQLAMRSGSLDGDWGITNPQTLPQWQSIPGTSLTQTEAAESVFLSFNVTQAPLDDIHIRKAIAYSVDREGLLQAIYQGHATLLKGLFDTPGFADVAPSDEAAQELLDGLPQYEQDLVKAKAEMSRSSQPNGFEITLPYDNSQTYSQLIAQNLQQNLSGLGIKVKLEPLSSAAYYSKVLAQHAGIGINLFASYPEDPVGGLALTLGEANEVEYGLNFANYSPPPVERAWQQMTGSLDDNTRWQGVQTSLKSIANDVPYVPLFNAPQIVILGSGLEFDGPVGFTDMINGRWPYLLRAG